MARGGDVLAAQPLAHHALIAGQRGILKTFLALTFILGFTFDGKKWKKGRIYNPEDGKRYKADLELKDGKLVCTSCGAAYRIEDDIPIMLIMAPGTPCPVQSAVTQMILPFFPIIQ